MASASFDCGTVKKITVTQGTFFKENNAPWFHTYMLHLYDDKNNCVGKVTVRSEGETPIEIVELPRSNYDSYNGKFIQ